MSQRPSANVCPSETPVNTFFFLSALWLFLYLCKSLWESNIPLNYIYLGNQIFTEAFASNCSSCRFSGARFLSKMTGHQLYTSTTLYFTMSSLIYSVLLQIRAQMQWEANAIMYSEQLPKNPSPYPHVKIDKWCFVHLCVSCLKMKDYVPFKWLFLYFFNAANGPLREETNIPKYEVLFGKPYWDSNVLLNFFTILIDLGRKMNGVVYSRLFYVWNCWYSETLVAF